MSTKKEMPEKVKKIPKFMKCETCDGLKEFVVLDLGKSDTTQKLEELYNWGYVGYRHFVADKAYYVFRHVLAN
jgi:hypothetical protein